MIEEELAYHSLYDYVVKEGKSYPKWVKNPIEHLMPSIDEGVRYVDCITNLSDKSPSEVANYNPKYAQYSITILRTFYNFCWTFKSGNGDILTPAQRIGITDKQFNYNDIIYFS